MVTILAGPGIINGKWDDESTALEAEHFLWDLLSIHEGVKSVAQQKSGLQIFHLSNLPGNFQQQRLLVDFLRDPRRSADYALNPAMIAQTALRCLQGLCRDDTLFSWDHSVRCNHRLTTLITVLCYLSNVPMILNFNPGESGKFINQMAN